MTKGEAVFAEFCKNNNIIHEDFIGKAGPDFKINLAGQEIFIEIKQIDNDQNFREMEIVSRVVGKHVRKKINLGQTQIQSVASHGYPTILLIYNNLDWAQKFGTERHDFLAGMFGELTITFVVNHKTDEIIGVSKIFHGRNAKMVTRQNGIDVFRNTSFSAVGHLSNLNGVPSVHIYENPNAKNKINYHLFPSFIRLTRIELETD